MKRYGKWSPTAFDTPGLMIGDEDRSNWLVVPVAQNRDSGCFAQSNFATALALLGGESETVEVHRFGHWGPGWFEIILVAPGTEAEKKAEEIEALLENYPVLDDEDLCEREHVAAAEVWKNCYSPAERIKYIRERESQFEFRDYQDMLGCVRGKWFCGYDSELLD